MIKNNRGSALLEGIPVFGLIFLFLTGILIAVYLIFGRAWIQFQAEQALYCLSVKSPQSECRAKLEAKLDHFLPWGTWHVQMQTNDGNSNVRVEWKFGKYDLVIAKNLNVEQSAKSKALLF